MPFASQCGLRPPSRCALRRATPAAHSSQRSTRTALPATLRASVVLHVCTPGNVWERLGRNHGANRSPLHQAALPISSNRMKKLEPDSTLPRDLAPRAALVAPVHSPERYRARRVDARIGPDSWPIPGPCKQETTRPHPISPFSKRHGQHQPGQHQPGNGQQPTGPSVTPCRRTHERRTPPGRQAGPTNLGTDSSPPDRTQDPPGPHQPATSTWDRRTRAPRRRAHERRTRRAGRQDESTGRINLGA
jgi:hypothetical protein